MGFWGFGVLGFMVPILDKGQNRKITTFHLTFTLSDDHKSHWNLWGEGGIEPPPLQI